MFCLCVGFLWLDVRNVCGPLTKRALHHKPLKVQQWFTDGKHANVQTELLLLDKLISSVLK